MYNKKTNTLCLVGFIVSLISLLINFWGLVGMVGLILSVVGINNLNEKKETGNGLAIAGIIIGAISVAYAFVLLMSM